MGIGNHERPNKGRTDVWLTPLPLIRSLGEFDLDPCGELDWSSAKEILSSRGLEGAWKGRVWLNPPYSEVGKWVERLRDHAVSGGSGIALVFARTETKWFQSVIHDATSIFFPKGRIKFVKADKSEAQWTSGAPSVFLAFGERPDWKRTGLDGWIAK